MVVRIASWALVALLLVTTGVACGTTNRGRGASSRTSTSRSQRVRTTSAGTDSCERQQELALPSPSPDRTLSLPILMYHRVDELRPTLPAITQRLTVSPADFAAQMQWLRANRFQAVTQRLAFEALEHGASLPRKPIMITFDDGYRDVLGKASPVLEQLRMPATAYVITDRISAGDPSFLTWGNLHALEARGICIGSHTVTHRELTLLSDGAAVAELRNSRRVLEQRLGHPVQWLSYPAGREDARIVTLARAAGYVLAVTTHPGTEQTAARPLELHRYEVLDSTHVGGLAQLLGP
jgi:peptidoglycan/xylan/chitin deacetylase (PgdA/CDA1 family)